MKKSEVEVAVDSVLAMIAEALQANERVELRGFCSFVVKERKERQGRRRRALDEIAARQIAADAERQKEAERREQGAVISQPAAVQ